MTERVYIEPEIWRIRVDMPDNPLRYLNAYVLRDGEESLLIDTGFNRAECEHDLTEGLQDIGVEGSCMKVLLTHLHSDHCGLARQMIERGARLYMGSIDYAMLSEIKAGKIWPYMEQLYIREGYPEEEIYLQNEGNQGRKYAVNSIFPTAQLEDGDTIRVGRYEGICLHTPGHTPGHLMLYLPEQKILFSGDHILFDITPNIAVWKGVPQSLRDYLNSLEKTEKLDAETVFPAHRTCSMPLRERVEQIKAHHAARLDELLEAVTAHPGSTAFFLAGCLTWSARGKKFQEFPPHQKWFAMSETLSHLYYLIEDGAVIRTDEGVFRYVRNPEYRPKFRT